MDTKKELVVSAIENGTVIDHIPTESVYRVIHILGLEEYKDEVSKVALVAPFVTIITIQDYKVIEKFATEIPDHVENFVKCANPKCITNCEAVPTKFDIVDKENLMLRCHYCEKFTTKETIHFIH